MNKKLVSTVEKAINNKQTTRGALCARIETAKAGITEAEQLMEKATAADNEKDFITAADKRRFNESIIQTCEEEIRTIDSEEDYNKVLDTIKADAEESIKEAGERAAGLVSELYAVCDAIDAEVQEHNDLIVRWAVASGKSPQDQIIYFTSSSSELVFLKRMLRQRKNTIGREHKSASIYAGVNTESGSNDVIPII